MTRALGWLGAGLLIVGVLGAVAARALWPTTSVRYEYWSDLATLILTGALLVAAPLLLSAGIRLWHGRQIQRALGQQTQAQETERRRFIQRLDHELKNPLTAIQVQLDNLQVNAGAHTPAIADVRAQTDRLVSLTRGLRRLADLETRPLEFEKVELRELLDEVAELLQAGERLQLDVQTVPWPLPPLTADRELLLIALRNLVDNALKYSIAAVQVRARDLSGALMVEVVDTGRGIPPEELPLVREELYRGSNTRDVMGSGLGLAIVQRIVERHGGTLELRSRAGQGTIATVLVPYGD